MRVIVVNSGSSSIKYEAFDVSRFNASAKGLLERIGTSDSRLKHRWLDPSSGRWEEMEETRAIVDHRQGLSLILEVSSRVRAGTTPEAVFGVGHRVVHGMKHSKPERVTRKLVAELHRITPYAPNHLPREIKLIEAFSRRHPRLPQVACFDTAFHRTMPQVAKVLPIPRRDAAKGVERYGFQGPAR